MCDSGLSHGVRPARPGPRLLRGPELAGARAHEACGPARRTFALMLARHMEGPVVWIAPAWQPERLNPDGVRRFAEPGRLIHVHPRRAEDLLWSAEESLRAGVVPLVVVELPAPPALTPVRRLHLAAERGAQDRAAAPLAVLLLPGSGGAAGVESRWHMAPRHTGETTAWRLERRRARTEPPKAWAVTGRLALADLPAGAPGVFETPHG